jgi:diacylglycerol O-acyltransferase
LAPTFRRSGRALGRGCTVEGVHDRLSPLDSSFLAIEDGVSHMHIASIGIFEGPVPRYGDLVAMVAGKLRLVPRYRQVIERVPGDLGRPVWVDDRHFNIEDHVRHTALPEPGGEKELRKLVGRIMSQQLDRSKPLWEIWMVDGLEGGRWALASKTHHCMVDGVSGTELLSVIMDLAPVVVPPEPVEWEPQPRPSQLGLAVTAVVDMVKSPYEQLQAARSALRGPRNAVREVWAVGRGLTAMLGAVRPTPPSSLNGPIGPHRTWAWASSSVDDVRVVRREHGGTFNDVVLACITAGFRELLASRGESADRVVRTMVPVSVRPRSEQGLAVGDGVLANKVSAMFAELPVYEADPLRRLEIVSEQMAGLKDSQEALAGEALTSLSGFAPPMLLALGGRIATKGSQRNINTVTTNVPGPQVPLYVLGRRMLQAYPFVPLGAQMRVTVAIFSYDGQVNYGVTGDYDAAPDVDVLCRGIEKGLADLLTASARDD